MQTFTEARSFIDDPGYTDRREYALRDYSTVEIDAPIRDLISDVAKLECCYSLQCCGGHFVHSGQKDIHGIEPLAHYSDDTEVEYRIAYLALCIQHNEEGEKLFQGLQEIALENPEFIQFGSADWFWNRCVNSYAIQVEPKRFMFQDTAIVPIEEALRIEMVRNDFFRNVKSRLFH